jgi:hypothetical protein
VYYHEIFRQGTGKKIEYPAAGGLVEWVLRLQYVALVDPPTAKEAMAYHLLTQQENQAEQDD